MNPELAGFTSAGDGQRSVEEAEGRGWADDDQERGDPKHDPA